MSMRRRVLTAIMSVTTIVVLLFAVPLGFVLERLLDQQAVFALEHRADVAARNIDLTNPTDSPDDSELPTGPEQFALYSAEGKRVTGQGPPRLGAVSTSLATPRRSTVEEGSQLVSTLPVMSGESILGFIRVQRSLSTIDSRTNRALALLLGGAVGVVAVGWILALRLAQTITTATESLRQSAMHLGDGDFTTTAPTTGIHELDDVGTALSSTAQQLGELVDREHAFSADVSHQLRTPIAGLRAALETELAFPRDDRTIIVHESLADLQRFEQTVEDILSFARHEQRAQVTTVNVTELIGSLHRDWDPTFLRVKRPLAVVSSGAACLAVGNRALLRQALDALLDNALKHGRGLTTVRVTTDDTSVTIHVTDSGDGAVAESNSDQSSSDQSNAGLGLALTQRLIRAQGGRLINALDESNPTVRVVLLLAR